YSRGFGRILCRHLADHEWTRQQRHFKTCGQCKNPGPGQLEELSPRRCPSAPMTNAPMIYEVIIAGNTQRVELTRGESGWLCKLNGREFPLDVISTGEGLFSILVNGKSYEIKQETTATETNIVVGHQRFN